MTTPVNQILQLIEKAADTTSPDEAMKFAQAALNAANTVAILDRMGPLANVGDR